MYPETVYTINIIGFGEFDYIGSDKDTGKEKPERVFMDIYSIITMIGGLALFLYGMHVLSAGLEKTAGGKMESILKKMTSNRFKGLLLGAVVTAAIQSSSAVTVMLVGLVNSGIMQLPQAISVTMGSNIGTTITAWILSLTGIDSSSMLINMLKPVNFSPIVAFIGIILIMAGKKQNHKDIGTICLGFAVLMFGMNSMSGAVEALADNPEFVNILTFFKNPVMGVLVGFVFTAIIQSSSASVGVLQALSVTGAITYGAAIPIIMGQNIGTCVSSLLASVGTSKNAKRVAAVHVLFNVLGTVVCLAAWLIADGICNFVFTDTAVEPFEIAVLHSIFNVVTTVVLFPFATLLEKLVKKIIPDAKDREAEVLLDERIMTVPGIAVAKAADMTAEMASVAKKAVKGAIGLLDRYDSKAFDEISSLESKLDRYEDELGTYLVKLSRKEVNDTDSNNISKLLHTISDFERIGDHANNLLDTAKEMHDKKISFSKEAKEELDNLSDAVTEILSITVKAFKNDDVALAATVEPLEEVIDKITQDVRARHIGRLKKGECTIELGFILTDVLTNYERISDHCSNIAVAVIETQKGMFDSHEYLHAVKAENDGTFAECYERYLKQYSI